MKYQKLEAVGRSTFFSDKDFLIKKKKSVHCERFSEDNITINLSRLQEYVE